MGSYTHTSKERDNLLKTAGLCGAMTLIVKKEDYKLLLLN